MTRIGEGMRFLQAIIILSTCAWKPALIRFTLHIYTVFWTAPITQLLTMHVNLSLRQCKLRSITKLLHCFQYFMLGEPYSDCQEDVCSREDCLSDCELALTEQTCGCKDPLISDLCPSVQLQNVTDTRKNLADCDFEGMKCLISNDGWLLYHDL